jgi:hypothetical protein
MSEKSCTTIAFDSFVNISSETRNAYVWKACCKKMRLRRYLVQHHLLNLYRVAPCTVKKVIVFPVPGRDVTNQTLPGRE